MELFNKLRSRSLTELDRQISENGPAPPPVESKKEFVSLSLLPYVVLCCMVHVVCMSASLFLLIFPGKNEVWNTIFPCGRLFEAFDLPQWFHVFCFS